ncbi:TPA: helix-turn-helix transcriptional regulator [Streptococcus agalactiae]|uniref:helix-turn-helix transcriptional regulator n=1 Tax=Finegoldia magna TaxID=1260 RepID=UPI002B3D3118|nr:helix-turn-helix transcriptional regulator [Streptococcus pyogenes]
MHNRVKEIRKSLGITQTDLAKSVGVSRQYLSDIENMRKQPTIKIAFHIAFILGVKVDDLFFCEDVLCYCKL